MPVSKSELPDRGKRRVVIPRPPVYTGPGGDYFGYADEEDARAYILSRVKWQLDHKSVLADEAVYDDEVGEADTHA